MELYWKLERLFDFALRHSWYDTLYNSIHVVIPLRKSRRNRRMIYHGDRFICWQVMSVVSATFAKRARSACANGILSSLEM